jgi:hypothetical protein
MLILNRIPFIIILFSIFIQSNSSYTTPQEIVIHNNHKLAQTLHHTEQQVYQPRFAGHTKSEASYCTAIAPYHMQTQKQVSSGVQNAHIVTQTTLHSHPSRTQYQDPFLPHEERPLDNTHNYKPTPFNNDGWTQYLSSCVYQLGTTTYILGGIGICYVGLLAKLAYTSSYTIWTESMWTSWKPSEQESNSKTDELRIAQELRRAMQEFYSTISPTTQNVEFLVLFMNDINKEIQELTWFIKTHAIITRLNLNILFPNQEQSLIRAQQKINKLEYLKHIVHVLPE